MSLDHIQNYDGFKQGLEPVSIKDCMELGTGESLIESFDDFDADTGLRK